MANVTPLQGAQAPKPKMDELVSWEESPLFANARSRRYNPDELAGRKGLDIYNVMRIDEQVKAVSVFKRDAITARGWTFKYAKDCSLTEDEQDLRIRIFNDVVKRMRGSFEDALNGIATGRDFGFSMTEKVYSQLSVDSKMYVGISHLITRDPVTFDFYTDEYGMLRRLVQRVNGREQELDLSRFIHYVHAPEFDRYFGRSDLREAYRSWFAKDNLVKMWLIYLERLGGGFAVARRTAESTMINGTPEYNALRNMLTNIKSASGIILPKGVEIEVIMPQSTDQYQQAVTFHDLAIAKALLVPNLLGISHAGQTGSYSQSQTQFDAFIWTLNADAKRLEATLNEQLFRDIGDQNFGDDQYPEFCFNPASLDHMKWTLTSWKEMVAAGIVEKIDKDEDYIRSLLEMPEKEDYKENDKSDSAGYVEDSTDMPYSDSMQNESMQPDSSEQVMAPQTLQNIAQDPTANVQSTALNGAQVTAMLEIVRAVSDGTLPAESARAIIEAAFPSLDLNLVAAIVSPIQVKEAPAPIPIVATEPAPVQPMSRIVAHTHDGNPRTCTKAAFDRAVQRVEFAVIEQKTASLAKRTVNELALRMAKAVQYAVGDPADFMQEPTRIQDAKLSGDDIGKLKQISINALTESWNIGSLMGSKELNKARGNTKVDVAMMKAHFASLRGKAADFFEANGFRMAGNMSDGARAIIQQELQLGVKSGRSPDETKSQSWDRLVSKGFTNQASVSLVEDSAKVEALLNELWVDTEEAAVAYLNTLVTTNTFEALNEARYAEFTDPAVSDFVEGLEYSAVLDESTTEICSELNGMQLTADNPAWDTLRPPNHYNCRSLLIPITTIDDWDGQESEIPDVEPQVGF
jgi:SPP1 gp7 family putative phage head morphogenesis protein